MNNWKDNAAIFLQENTQASIETIQRFVDCHWISDASEEENLENFYLYEDELKGVYSY